MHRKWREQTILACLDEGIGTIPEIVGRLYGTIDAGLKDAAALSVLAHLEHLAARGLVATPDGTTGLGSAFCSLPSSSAS